eukprot:m.83338 g.83338  ORF g.83338 m.83338 type:complete len:314 (-) comp12917_c0_seq1:48-989(-)
MLRPGNPTRLRVSSVICLLVCTVVFTTLLLTQFQGREQQHTARPSKKTDLPWLYLITPTYKRHNQKADMTRFANTLRQVPNLHWIVIEDAQERTELVSKFMKRCGVKNFTHIHQKTPKYLQRAICKVVNPRIGCPSWKLGKEAELWTRPRGVEQRNAGLQVVRDLRPQNGVVYFADDDNSYDLELFDMIRKVKRVGAWTVGLSGGLIHEGPIVEDGEVISWHVGWRPDRPFPIDMASFAINTREIMSRPQLKFDGKAERGFLESKFLLGIIKGKNEIEPFVPACNCVLVWHTRTQDPDLKAEKYAPSDPDLEV